MPRALFKQKKSKTWTHLRPAVYPLVGVGLLIPTAALWISLGSWIARAPWSGPIVAPFLAGAGAYALFHFVFRRPTALYVFGHELTHAVVAWSFGYKIKSLFVSEKGGEVELSHTNTAVALAPYCLPLYSLLLMVVYVVVNYYVRFSSPPLWVPVGLGATTAFHVALTSHALHQGQPDLDHAGPFFSIVALLFCNALGLALVASVCYPDLFSWRPFFETATAMGRKMIFHTGIAAGWALDHFPRP